LAAGALLAGEAACTGAVGGGIAGTGCGWGAVFGADALGIPDGALAISPVLPGVVVEGADVAVAGDVEEEVAALSAGALDAGAIAAVLVGGSGVDGVLEPISFVGSTGVVIAFDESAAAVDCFAPSPANIR
jgi:hypothetical protein